MVRARDARLKAGVRVLDLNGYAATVIAIEGGIAQVVYDYQTSAEPKPVPLTALRFVSEPH